MEISLISSLTGVVSLPERPGRWGISGEGSETDAAEGEEEEEDPDWGWGKS